MSLSSSLAQQCPDLGHLRLGSAPTPVRPLDLGWPDDLEVWVKDESVFGDGAWGGNKVRKLEWILPEALARKRRGGTGTLFTVGGIGTHWGLACALYAADAGQGQLKTVLGLVDQPVDDHVREQLTRLEASDATIYRYPTARRLKLAAPWILARHRPWYLPAGGSNPIGTLAYIDVAFEIADQVAAGELPEPGTVVVPVGSGGTYAGLVLGLRLAGLRTRVLGVVVNDMVPLDARTMARLANRTGRHLRDHGMTGVRDVRPEELDLRADWLGQTYGDPTPAAVAEVARAAEIGLDIEPVYTGKALAAIRDLALSPAPFPGPVLWLNTHGPR